MVINGVIAVWTRFAKPQTMLNLPCKYGTRPPHSVSFAMRGASSSPCARITGRHVRRFPRGRSSDRSVHHTDLPLVKELAENPLIHSLLQIHVMQDDEQTVPAQFQFGPFGDWRLRRQTAKVPAPRCGTLFPALLHHSGRTLHYAGSLGRAFRRPGVLSLRGGFICIIQVVLISQREFRSVSRPYRGPPSTGVLVLQAGPGCRCGRWFRGCCQSRHMFARLCCY
ncbi:MAG: hypothetical protein QOJ99_6064 [Bryobacterales bacterium]|jgi:hypothetical protein|nr:hypothetical protein [Bryobacterales bacterium]